MSAALWGWMLAAQAVASESIDTELVRPQLSDWGLPGVESARRGGRGAARVGLFFQHEQDPLVLYQEGLETGVIVQLRQRADLGLSWEAADRLALRAGLPLVLQSAGTVPELSGDGFYMGDPSLGFAWTLVQQPVGAIALRADGHLPLGTGKAWIAEDAPRVSPALLAELGGGRLVWLTELGLAARPLAGRPGAMEVGSELTLGAGVRFDARPGRMALHGALVGRSGLDAVGQAGVGTPVEALSGLILYPRDDLRVDVGVGRGLTAGYGTSEFRVVTGLTYTRRPAPEVPETLRVRLDAVVNHPDAVALSDAEEPPPPPEDGDWDEGQLARIEGREIAIREPIYFEVDTARILPLSLPVIAAVAGVMAENGQITYLLVEGHASEEGAYDYNDDLSNLRARTIFRALIEEGVHPYRLSYRGFGEVMPAAERPGAPQDDEGLAAHRRVVFHIRHTLGAEELPPAAPETVRLPWSGEAVTFVAPKLPEPPPAAEDESTDWQNVFEDEEAQ